MFKSKSLVVVVIVMSLVLSLSGMIFAQRPVTLEFLHMTWLPGSVRAINQAIADFEAQNPHIKINQTTVAWGDSVNQTLITLLGGMQLDIVMSNATRGALFKEMGVWTNLEELEDPSYWDQFLGAEQFAKSLDGHYDSILLEGSTWGLFYRTDLFEEAGLDPNQPPRNWGELVEFGQKLTKDTNGDGQIDQWGIGFPASGWLAQQYWNLFMYQNGNPIAYQDENGRWVSTIAEPSGLEATQFFADLVHKYNIAPRELAGMDWEQVTIGLAEGNFAMMMNGMWVMQTITDGYPDVVDLYATAQYPVGPTGVQVNYGGPQTISIPRLSKYKEEAWEFLKFLQNGSPTYLDQYALAASSLNWNKSYMELDFAQQPKVKPFVKSMEGAMLVPKTSKWDSYQALHLAPTLQNLLLGITTPEAAVKYLNQKFNEMH